MLITPHVLAGTAIGLAVGNPVAGFVLGVTSHFVLDAVPHTDPGTWHYNEAFSTHSLDIRDFTTAGLDVASAVFGFALLSGSAPLLAAGPIAGAIGGALPDLFVVLGLLFKKLPTWKGLKWYYDLVEKYHYTARPSQWVLGVVTQLAVIAGALVFILSR